VPVPREESKGIQEVIEPSQLVRRPKVPSWDCRRRIMTGTKGKEGRPQVPVFQVIPSSEGAVSVSIQGFQDATNKDWRGKRTKDPRHD